MDKKSIKNKNNDFSSEDNKITPFEFIKRNYSNPKIEIIKRAWNNGKNTLIMGGLRCL